jgi:hypothetical protein
LSFKTALKYNYLNDHDANLTFCLQHENGLTYNMNIIPDFFKSQLEIKLNDESVHVIKVLLKFKLNLLQFFTFDQLTSKFINNFFAVDETTTSDDDDEEELFQVSKLVISFVFNDLHILILPK